MHLINKGNALFYSLKRKERLIQRTYRIIGNLYLVGREGFEPSTNGLKVRCSTD